MHGPTPPVLSMKPGVARRAYTLAITRPAPTATDAPTIDDVAAHSLLYKLESDCHHLPLALSSRRCRCQRSWLRRSRPVQKVSGLRRTALHRNDGIEVGRGRRLSRLVADVAFEELDPTLLRSKGVSVSGLGEGIEHGHLVVALLNDMPNTVLPMRPQRRRRRCALFSNAIR